jgi:HEAT repeat protein
VVVCCGLICWASLSIWQSAPVYQMAKAVRSGSIVDRTEAIGSLGNVSKEDVVVAIPILINLLGDEDERIQIQAALALGTSGLSATAAGPEGLQQLQLASRALVQALQDARPGVRMAAISALASLARVNQGKVVSTQMYDPVWVMGALLKILDDPSDTLRLKACETISVVCRSQRAAGSRALEGPPPSRLVKAFQDDASIEVRGAAAAALGFFRLGDGEEIRGLVDGLRSDSDKLRGGCQSALWTLVPRTEAIPYFLTLLKDKDEYIRSTSINVLGRLRAEAQEAVPALIAVTKEPYGPVFVWPDDVAWREPAFRAAQALGMIAPGTPKADEAIAALEVMLGSKVESRREVAAWQLESFRPVPVSTLKALVTVATRPDADTDAFPYAIRSVAKLAPGSSESGRVVSALIEILDSKAKVRRASAALALAEFGKAAAPALERLRELEANDPDGIVRQNAAVALKVIE